MTGFEIMTVPPPAPAAAPAATPVPAPAPRLGSWVPVFVLLAFFVPLLPAARLEAQQPAGVADVIGAVIDARTGARIGGAVVRFPAADRYTLSADDGMFTLRNIPRGMHEVAVHRIGYREQVFRVSVEPGHRHLFELEPAPILLEGVEVVVGEDPARRILDRAARSRALGPPGAYGNPVFWSAWDREAIEKAGFDEPRSFLTRGPPRIVIRPCVGLGLPADRLCISPPFAGIRLLPSWGQTPVMGLNAGRGRGIVVFLDDRPLGPLEELETLPMDLIHRVEIYGDRGEQGVRLYTGGYLRLVAEGIVHPDMGGGTPELYDDLVRERARQGLPPPGVPGPPRP